MSAHLEAFDAVSRAFLTSYKRSAKNGEYAVPIIPNVDPDIITLAVVRYSAIVRQTIGLDFTFVIDADDKEYVLWQDPALSIGLTKTPMPGQYCTTI